MPLFSDRMKVIKGCNIQEITYDDDIMEAFNMIIPAKPVEKSKLFIDIPDSIPIERKKKRIFVEVPIDNPIIKSKLFVKT